MTAEARRGAGAEPAGFGLRARSLLFDVYAYGSMAVMGVLFAPAAVLSRDAAYFAMRLYCRQALWMLDRLCGLKTRLDGPIPRGAVVIAAEHQSFLDILMLMRGLDRPKFVMKRSLVWAPIFGLYALRIGAAPIDRAAGGKAIRAMTERLSQQAGEAGQIVIFPQGARSPYGAPLRLKRGVAAIVRAERAPCAPAATNTGRFWARRSLLRRPGLAIIRFGPALAPGGSASELMAAIEAGIEAERHAIAREEERRAEAREEAQPKAQDETRA